jgi:hypothetical protein
MGRLRFLAIVLFITFFIGGQAQNNYTAGWVLLNSGDTLKGTVLNKDWAGFWKRCKFTDHWNWCWP